MSFKASNKTLKNRIKRLAVLNVFELCYLNVIFINIQQNSPNTKNTAHVNITYIEIIMNLGFDINFQFIKFRLMAHLIL